MLYRLFRIATDPWGVMGMILALWVAIFGVLYVMSMVAAMPSRSACEQIRNPQQLDMDLCGEKGL